MREIEFRGRRVEIEGPATTRKIVPVGEWVYGYLTLHHYPHNLLDIISDEYSYAVDPETVGQYTGLKDKHGVKIFEGDIVKTGRKPYMPSLTGEIIWKDGGMRVCFPALNEKDSLYSVDFFSDTNAEVIGNIHDEWNILQKQRLIGYTPEDAIAAWNKRQEKAKK